MTGRTDKTQAIATRRNLLNVIRELEADAERCLRHAEVLRREVERIEQENEIERAPNFKGIRGQNRVAFIRNDDGTVDYPIAQPPNS